MHYFPRIILLLLLLIINVHLLRATINQRHHYFNGRRTPPKDLEMDIEIDQGASPLQHSEEKAETARPTPRKWTKATQTRARRSTRHRMKTTKPVQALKKGKCTPNSCKNGGQCQSMKSSSNSDDFLFCHCRLGYDGVECERSTSGIRFPKFISNGYIAFPEGIINEHEFRLSVYVKPAIFMAGTLVAFKNSALSNHFLLGIESNKFVFRFENSMSRKEIRHQTVVVNSNDRWYKVEIERKGNNGTMFVNNIETTLVAIEMFKNQVEKVRTVMNKNEEMTSNFICGHCLFLGGHPQLLSRVKQNPNLFGFIENPYIGCMRNLVINEAGIDMRLLPFYGHAVEGLGVEDCSEGLCDSHKCENKGECQISDDYKPVCHCGFGFNGENCTEATPIKMPSFVGNSYASYIGLRGTSRSENHIFIRFKPVSDTGILLYQGYSQNRRGDFLSIYLINGYPWTSFDLGSGTISLRSKKSLAMGTWHTIRFNRLGRKGTLVVNGDEEEDIITGYSPGEQVQLTIRHNLMLGGIDSLDNVSASLSIKKGFQGCVQTLFVDNHHVKLVEESEKSRNLANCESHTCGNIKKACWEDGECIPDNNDFVCSCPLGFVEEFCQTKIHISSIQNPNFNGSSYLVYTDQTILKKLSDSKFNFSLFINLRKSQSKRFLLLATRTSQFNVDHYFSLKINAKNGIDFVVTNGIERVEVTVLNNLPLLSDHRLQMLKNGNLIQFMVNSTIVQKIELQLTSLSTIGFSKLFIGGADLPTAISLNMPVQPGIIGCLKQMSLDSQPIKVSDTNDGRSVSECGALTS